MKAILQDTYGSPDVLRLAEVERPAVGEDGVLVRVLAAALNKADWHLLTGKPYLLRTAGYGFFRPSQPILGNAVAGRVEAVGPKVTAFKVGDEVFGEVTRGGFAEYVCMKEDALAAKPAGLSFEEAAALPLAGTTALQGLRDAVKLQPGESVLVIGAGGGVGTYVVQIAKAMGATVTGVCSASAAELVRGLGADRVIDYASEDFAAGEERYDVIFDLVGDRTLADCRAALRPKGRYLASAGASGDWIGPLGGLLAGVVSNVFSDKPYVPFLALPAKKDLIALTELVAAGKLRPAIGRRLTLDEVPEAMRVLGTGHSRARSVVTL